MSLLRRAAPVAVSGLIAMVAALPALAQDNKPLLDRFKAVLAENGTVIAWQSDTATTNADGQDVITLKDVTLKMSEQTVSLPTIELVEPEQSDEGYTINTIALPAYRHSEGEMIAEISDASLDGVVLYKEGTKSPFGTPLWYDTARVGEMRMQMKGKELFTLTEAYVNVEIPEGADTSLGFTGGAEAFTLALGQVEDPATRAAATALGYETLEGFIEMEGDWNSTNGQLALNSFEISGTDAGTLGLSLNLGGYTPDFIKSLGELQAQMAANQGTNNSAQGLAMLGLMQQLTFGGATIQFTDDSLTNKVIDFIAKQQNQTPAAIKNQAKAVVPFMMMQINSPELTQMVTTAVSAFLDDPQNISISATPTSPVPFALIMAGAMTAPQALPQQLGVKVVANEDE